MLCLTTFFHTHKCTHKNNSRLHCLYIFFNNNLAIITVYNSNWACSPNPHLHLIFIQKGLFLCVKSLHLRCWFFWLLLLNSQMWSCVFSQCVRRHLGIIKAKLKDRNGLFEGLYVSQTHHKPSVRLPNLSGNGAWQQSTETHMISVSQM